ncbi:Uu.00g068730.m01.CDS01 [Anthostomella pinea]|uniref:Uu.00g068730.m01.CDS01 n=1 Tax=Anthostomella pinea TaxID=933095 RepID=A0AAI8VVL0_9PEZI|nr:Uu.00g068730.m01.CDS01 [Anthostomella pinea]
MASLRSRKFLRCFYCGRRSNLRFEGQKSFDCSSCDATNWLDENGEITDPPASTSSIERTHVQYAVPRASAVRSPSPPVPSSGLGANDSIFCATCLRNQHMLTSSLAQFEFPDDPTNAEYAARERKYFALRRDLEQRYPQMCAECEPKVEKRIHEASYTAQTDHLRRMMDRTRSERKEVRKRGILDVVDLAGKWSWYIGFALQFVWQVTVLYTLVMEQYATSEDESRIAAMLKTLRWINVDELPYTHRLMQWAINLGMCSFPWNPRFKQTIRGFTAHILGFRQWYTYQLLILLIRLVCLSIAQYSKARGLPPTTQLGAQLVIALLMVHIFRVAGKSIRTDTTPLFRLKEKAQGPQQRSPTRPVHKDPNDLGSILDDILHAPSKPHGQNESALPLGTHPHGNYSTNRVQHKTYGSGVVSDSPGSALETLQISGPTQFQRQEPQITHYEEEMDWSPSASQHRAFSSYNPYKVKNTNPRFSDTPIEPKSGPIWYKVPPAPTNPAQRLRNPPMRPIIRESPKEKKENFFQPTARGPVEMGSAHQANSPGLNLAEPKFYAPEPRDDPRDGLSNMFASSFNISPSPEEEAERGPRTIDSGSNRFRQPLSSQNRTMTRIAEVMVLLGALCGWIWALGTNEHHGPPVALASICACLIVSIRLAADLEVDTQAQGDKPSSVYTPSWAKLALAQVIAALLLMWNVWSGSVATISTGTFGNVLFCGMIIHHMWHIFA